MPISIIKGNCLHTARDNANIINKDREGRIRKFRKRKTDGFWGNYIGIVKDLEIIF